MPDQRPDILSSFLFRIIKNHALNRLKYITSEKRKKSVTVSLDELGECTDGKSSVSENFDEAELVKAINEFLYGLNKEKRFIFIRRYWYNDDYSDIAASCHMREENVRKILSRLRIKLKKHLKERGFT